MAKRNKRSGADVDEKQLQKEAEETLKCVRFNCPSKRSMFEGNEVDYFSGQKAIDVLMDKYGPNAKKNVKYEQRADAIRFMVEAMQHQMFFRAKVLVPRSKDAKRPKSAEKPEDSPRTPKSKEHADRKSKTEKSDEQANENAALISAAETAGESAVENKKEDKEEERRKKKKIKLAVHDIQVFNDDADSYYIWVFDPTPFYKKLIGALIVLGVILACLFPLWPDWLRLGVYYLSVTGIALFGLLLGTALARTILFVVIYCLTFGRHRLWILPNLTEDCGFFESFQPWYTYEYHSPKGSTPAPTTTTNHNGKKD